MTNFKKQNAYGYPSPSSVLNNPPISAKRAPTTADIGYPLGQLWIFSSSNAAYILTSVVANSATWQLLEAASGAGVFSSLVVTPGPVTLTGTTLINDLTANNTSIGAGGNTGTITIGSAASTAVDINGPVFINNSVNAGTAINTGSSTGAVLIGNAASTGLTITVGTGNMQIVGGGNTIGIGNDAAANTITIGSSTASNLTKLSSPITQLPGPVNIYTGAGAPSNGLALHVGDLYINTTAATAATRMYIATGVGAWTNVTCAA